MRADDSKRTNERFELQAELVRRYFHEVLDQGKLDVIESLFHSRCVMHRPGRDVTGFKGVRGVAQRRKESFSQFTTEIHDLFGAKDRLAARLTHRGVGAGLWRLRLGDCDASGKTVVWNAMAIFRFEDQKIIEEWVVRDESAIALQLGLIRGVIAS